MKWFFAASICLRLSCSEVVVVKKRNMHCRVQCNNKSTLGKAGVQTPVSKSNSC